MSLLRCFAQAPSVTSATKRPTAAFFPAHPAQVWMLHAVAEEIADCANVRWYLRDKDVSEEIARKLGLDFRLISRAGRGLASNARELAANIGRVARETRAAEIDCWISKYGAANIGAMLAGARSVSFNDDDYDVVPLVAWTSYPFAHRVLALDVTRMGPFDKNAVRYPSFHELYYLHPNRFAPDPAVASELGPGSERPYVIIRLSALTAHHDGGVRGLPDGLLRTILGRLAPDFQPLISSEKPLDADLERFRLRLPVERIHHAIAFAACVISDSQTMSAEAAVLGTPSLRISDFVGRISYLEELERYGLSFGVIPDAGAEALERLDWILALGSAGRRSLFGQRRQQLLADKIDPVPFAARIIKSALAPSGTHAQRSPCAG